MPDFAPPPEGGDRVPLLPESDARPERRWTTGLHLTLVLAVIAGISVTAALLYAAGLRQERVSLGQTATLVEGLTTLVMAERHDTGAGAIEPLIGQLLADSTQFAQLGRTGEILLGRDNGSSFAFLYVRKRDGVTVPRLSFQSEMAGPMRAALEGTTGSMIARDYRGVRVVAGFRPLAGGFGIVVKKDLSEIRQPYLTAALIASGIGLVIILLSGLIGRWITGPQLERHRQARVKIDHLSRLHAVLSQVNQAIIRAESQEKLFAVICRQVATYGRFRTVWIGQVEETTGMVRPVAWAGPAAEQIIDRLAITSADTDRGHGPTGTAIREGRVVVVNHVLQDPACAPWHELSRQAGLGSAASVPVLKAGRVIAALTIYATEPDFFGPEEARLLGEMGADISFALLTAETQRSLAASEDRLQLALMAANQGTYDLNVQTGEAIVSPEYARMLGYDPAGFRESNELWQERLHPDDREAVVAAFEDCIAGRRPLYAVEFRERTKEGRWKWILSLGRIVERDADGGPLRMLGTRTDVTERKLLEEEWARLSAVIEQSTELVLMTELDGTIIYVNPAFERVTGYRREEVLGGKPSLLQSGAQAPAFYANMWAHLVAGEAWRGRVVNRRKDGTQYVVEAIIQPVRDASGTVTNYVGVQRDVTHEHELDRQLQQAQKMEAVGQLTGGIAHDFNNLLSVITANAALLDGELPRGSEPAQYLTDIEQAAARGRN